MPDPQPTKRRPRPEERRTAKREQLWPGSFEYVWCRKHQDGFATVPRLLPLVLALIRRVSPSGDPCPVYVDLWCRVFDEGFVKVTDPHAFAFSSGYSGQRALRTWRERVDTLADLGFIQVKPGAGYEVGYILLVDPLKVIARNKREGRLDDEEAWWSAYVDRAEEIGAELPSTTQSAAPEPGHVATAGSP